MALLWHCCGDASGARVGMLVYWRIAVWPRSVHEGLQGQQVALRVDS